MLSSSPARRLCAADCSVQVRLQRNCVHSHSTQTRQNRFVFLRERRKQLFAQLATSFRTRGPRMAVFLAGKLFEMAVPAVMFIAATAAASLASLGTAASQQSDRVDCTLGEEKKHFSITKPGGTLQVTCLDSKNSRKPTGNPPQICVDNKCSEAESARLELACPGGKATLPLPSRSNSSSLVITCPQLPNTTTSILILCGEANPEKPEGLCAVELTVSAPPPEGPQVCAAPETTVRLGVHGKGAQTQFACASTGLTTLSPPQPNRVYKEDCSAEEDLKDLKLTTGKPYHILAAIEKPRKRILCYLCKAGSGKAGTGEQCKILIDVSAGSKRSERSAFGLALCCALAFLLLV